MKDFAPAAERNKYAIGEVLAELLPASGLVLEVASGTGQHVAHFAQSFPGLRWQPTDLDPAARDSIGVWVREAEVSNVCEPVLLDASAPRWPLERADAVVNINMIHIAPWEACLGLLAGASRVLAAEAPLVMYGPYIIDGQSAQSNWSFNQSLQRSDPAWAVRELRKVERAAAEHGFELVRVIDMPANNYVVHFRRCA